VDVENLKGAIAMLDKPILKQRVTAPTTASAERQKSAISLGN